MPGRRLLQRRGEDPPGQGLNQPRFLGERDEVHRRYDAALWVLPPDEGLNAGEAAIAKVDQWLELQKELIVFV